MPRLSANDTVMTGTPDLSTLDPASFALASRVFHTPHRCRFPSPAPCSPTLHSLEQNLIPHFLHSGKLTPLTAQTEQQTCFVRAEASSAAARDGSIWAISTSPPRSDAEEADRESMRDTDETERCCLLGGERVVRKEGRLGDEAIALTVSAFFLLAEGTS